MAKNIRKNLEELKLLDITKTETVGEIVEAMKYCSFGARMLGEVADTLWQWCTGKEKPIIVYAGYTDDFLGSLLLKMVEKKWFLKINDLLQFRLNYSDSKNPLLVVGRFSKADENLLYQYSGRVIYINKDCLASPKQLKEGEYSDVIFTDPNFIVPLLYYVLEERIDGKQHKVIDLVNFLCDYEGMAAEFVFGAKTFLKMLRDPDCSIFLTMSGAMTIAKMGLLICEMIDRGWVKYISSTGALIAHGLVENVGLKHYKHNPKYCDRQLAQAKLNRVTDTIEPEENFDHIGEILKKILSQSVGTMSPSVFNRMIGEYLAKNFPEARGILKSAYEQNVPVVIPAFIDSEIGNDIFADNFKRKKRDGQVSVIMDMEIDTQILIDKVLKAKKTGIFTIGGGVPRNNTQNVVPLMEYMKEKLKINWEVKSFFYGVRICPDPPYYGHLSGCTYKEGMSWRKMNPNGQFAEIYADATPVLPFLVRYAIENGF